jgi:hypothetical protein
MQTVCSFLFPRPKNRKTSKAEDHETLEASLTTELLHSENVTAQLSFPKNESASGIGGKLRRQGSRKSRDWKNVT